MAQILMGGFTMKRVLIAALLVLCCSLSAHAAWYEGGNLHGDKVATWLIATEANRLATAGDFVAGTTAPDKLRALSSSELKKAAQVVANCITSFGEQGVFDKNMSVEGAAMMCLRDNQKKYPFFMSKEGVDSQKKPKDASVNQDKEFPYTRQAVIKAYDDVMQQILKVRPLGAAQEERGKAQAVDIYFYTLTPQVAVMLQCNKGGSKPTFVKAIAADDGTKETQAMIVMNAMTLIAAVTPGWKGDERGAVAKELGITTGFLNSGASKSLSHRGRNFHFANNGQNGLTLTIQPE